MDTAKRIFSLRELYDILDALERLGSVYKILGFESDAQEYDKLAAQIRLAIEIHRAGGEKDG